MAAALRSAVSSCAVLDTHLPKAFFLVPKSSANLSASSFLACLQERAALMRSLPLAASSLSAAAFLALAFSETHLPKAF